MQKGNDNVNKMTTEDLKKIEKLIEKIDPEGKVFNDTSELLEEYKKVLEKKKSDRLELNSIEDRM